MSAQGSDLRRAKSHNTRGVEAAAQGHTGEAIAEFRAALSAFWGFAEAHNNLGIALATTHQFEAARDAFVLAIRFDPNWPDAHNNLGVVLQSLQQPALAIELADRAITLKEDFPEAHFNRGNGLRALDKLDDAAASYQRAIRYRTDYVDALLNLSETLQAAGRVQEAIVAWRTLLKLRPTFAEGYHQLGRLLHQAHVLPEAAVVLRRSLVTAPDNADVHHDLGNVLAEQGNLKHAAAAYGKAIILRPGFSDAHYNLGNSLLALHHEKEAEAAFRRAIEHQPSNARALNNLGNLLQARGDIDDAIACFTAAVATGKTEPEFFSNLGNAYKEVALIQQAITCYESAIGLAPTDPTWASHRLYTRHFDPDWSPDQLLKDHLDWDASYAAPILPMKGGVHRTPVNGRKLRIGYVSADFREHVVGRNILPLFKEHDRAQFEIYCYGNQLRFDAMTERFKGYADGWRDIRHLDDDDAAQLIARDEIDILVDLSLHMAGNRLLVFARRPAPVQITFAGYPSGTGLASMHARLTDPYLDPLGQTDALYRERSIRLPHTFWCFQPSGDEPEIGPLPADSNGYITFGCFNNFCKVNGATLRRWATVLKAVSSSRLILQAPRGNAQDWVRRHLCEDGIATERISFVDRQTRSAYLSLYNTIDIALDTLPYNGHTTSLEGMWMGVPLISCAGMSAVARAGFSLLSNLGIGELCAETNEQMASIAHSLAHDLPRLRHLRQSLRQRISQSPLGDAAGFARGVEQAYRDAWDALGPPQN